jgi:hypothetical protein
MCINKTTPKLETQTDIKISLTAHCAKLGLSKKLVNDTTRMSHNSCSIVNIEQIKLIYKLLKIYVSDI